ncbi:proline-rich protein 2-like [Sarcophilus harrisii]|uniref:proline-rich protein 2-like n=1 Tax=Sarcophilus harrisii TaxID=9305 RepID=UPI00130200DF|nr:proline-rich protein 2-like [Sarcophilus harrisii]
MLRGCPARSRRRRGLEGWRGRRLARAGGARDLRGARRAPLRPPPNPSRAWAPPPSLPGSALSRRGGGRGRFPGTFQEYASRGRGPGRRVKEAPERPPPPGWGTRSGPARRPDGGGPPLRALALVPSAGLGTSRGPCPPGYKPPGASPGTESEGRPRPWGPYPPECPRGKDAGPAPPLDFHRWRPTPPGLRGARGPVQDAEGCSPSDLLLRRPPVLAISELIFPPVRPLFHLRGRCRPGEEGKDAPSSQLETGMRGVGGRAAPKSRLSEFPPFSPLWIGKERGEPGGSQRGSGEGHLDVGPREATPAGGRASAHRTEHPTDARLLNQLPQRLQSPPRHPAPSSPLPPHALGSASLAPPRPVQLCGCSPAPGDQGHARPYLDSQLAPTGPTGSTSLCLRVAS